MNGFEGFLIDRGSAPYGHDPAGSESYDETLRGADGGETTQRGLDLKRALKEAAVNRWDRVALARPGKRPVAARDARAEIFYDEEKVVEGTA